MIVSRQNEKVKKIRSLLQKKYRDEYGEYLVFGLKLVKECLDLSLPIQCVLGTEDNLKKLSLVEGFYNGYEVIAVTEQVYDSVTDEKSPQGVLAVIKKPTNVLQAPTKNCIFLDGVSDPGNMGTIIRTAAASGYTELYLADSTDAYSPKTVRSSMGGMFRVKIYTGSKEQLVSVIDRPFVIASMEGEDVFNTVMPDRFCLVIGNEANGVSDYLRQKAEIKVSIPMQNGVESLNAGVSAGILMYVLKNNN
jgi:TrmH family RNA methyltransferase